MARKSMDRCCDTTGCHVEAIVSMDERGQLVLPKEIREKAKIRAGAKLAVVSCASGGEVRCLCLIDAGHLASAAKDMLGPLARSVIKK